MEYMKPALILVRDKKKEIYTSIYIDLEHMYNHKITEHTTT